MSASDMSGACSPPEPELTPLQLSVQKHAQNHLLTPVSGKVKSIDIDMAFRSGDLRTDRPKMVEFYRQGVAIDTLREDPSLYPQRLEVLQEAERAVLKLWMEAKKSDPLIQLHHTSPPKLSGLWTPRISRRSDLSPTPLALEAAQTLSNTPFQVNGELNDLFWEVRRQIPLGETEDTRFSQQEGFYPYRLRSMSLATEGEAFFVAMSVFCWALRMYAKSSGTLHPMFGLQCRAMLGLGYTVPIDHAHWRFFVSWCKRHFAKRQSMKDWCSSVLSDPTASLLAGVQGTGGADPYEYAACLEYARLERLPSRERRSSFMMELDTAGSGPMLIKLILGIAQNLAEIDVTAPGWIHPRDLLRNFILEVGVPFLSKLPKPVLLAILKAIFSPKTYGSGAGPVFDALVGQPGLRDGFTSSEDLIAMPAELRNQLCHGDPSIHSVYPKVKKMANLLSDAFNNCFPHLSKANADALELWKATPWQDRSIGGDLMMSPFRFKVDDANVEEAESPSDSKSGAWRVKSSYISPVTGESTNVSCTVDKGSCDTAGTSMLGRSLHRTDAEHRSLTVLHYKEMAVHGGDMYGIHDAGGCAIGEALTYIKADSQALIDMFPDACKKIGFTTSSRICN